ncbi:hypothetical protein HOG48_01775 [Candidatus Peregrinibacteria bacterium]|jgi:hypothetical protein|nr:hypothetical protein [Candidatus Peregrinibacteria bacterium]
MTETNTNNGSETARRSYPVLRSNDGNLVVDTTPGSWVVEYNGTRCARGKREFEGGNGYVRHGGEIDLIKIYESGRLVADYALDQVNWDPGVLTLLRSFRGGVAGAVR